jgi:hypothetical protein
MAFLPLKKIKTGGGNRQLFHIIEAIDAGPFPIYLFEFFGTNLMIFV